MRYLKLTAFAIPWIIIFIPLFMLFHLTFYTMIGMNYVWRGVDIVLAKHTRLVLSILEEEIEKKP